jgi:hypothetical protein
VEAIHGSALARTGISKIIVEDGNRYFRVAGDFLLDFEGTSLIRYFGSDSIVDLPHHIEVLCSGCFHDCASLCSLTFKSGSELTCIETIALSHCFLLKSMPIAGSIKEMNEKNWALGSALQCVTFASALSLRKMIETPTMDLSDCFMIKFVDCDCLLQLTSNIIIGVRFWTCVN